MAAQSSLAIRPVQLFVQEIKRRALAVSFSGQSIVIALSRETGCGQAETIRASSAMR